MRIARFLLPALCPLAAAAFWACVTSPDTTATTSTAAGGSGGLGGAGSGGSGGTGGNTIVGTGAGGTSTVACMLDNLTDPVAFCTQKVVPKSENMIAFDAARGIAQSWDYKTLMPDV